MTAMSVLLVHGAGSSGDAARALLGDSLASFETVEVIEDRTGDIGALLERLDRTAGSTQLAIGVANGATACSVVAFRFPARGGNGGTARKSSCLPAAIGGL